MQGLRLGWILWKEQKIGDLELGMSEVPIGQVQCEHKKG
jgi:hypothetical protein